MAPQIKTLRDLKRVAPQFGPDAVEWVNIKIAEASEGEDAEVIADDTQIMFLLLSFTERSAAMEGKPI